MRVDGAVAVVTGAASGLGRHTALALARRGATVIAGDLRTDGWDHVPDGVVPVPLDVTREQDVRDALDHAADHGAVRIVVNCAGIVTAGRVVSPRGPASLEEFVSCVTVNLVGTFNVVRLAAAVIAASDPVGEERGVIVNTASIAAFDGQIGQVAYAASKAGVAGMTLPIARDLARHRIRCVGIAPGMFDTAMLAQLPTDTREALQQQIPHPSRFGDPAEFAQLVCHVVQNPMLNGTTIRLDGALRMAPS